MYVLQTFYDMLCPSNIIFHRLVLYLIYFPPHLKFVQLPQQQANPTEPLLTPSLSNVKSDDWRLAVTLAWVVAIHMYAFLHFRQPALLT